MLASNSVQTVPSCCYPGVRIAAKGLPKAVAHQVQLGGETAMGAAYSLTAPLLLPLPPGSLNVVESTIQVSKSNSPSAFDRAWSHSKMWSKVPAFVQMRYQW
jgi:hypothetical protein